MKEDHKRNEQDHNASIDETIGRILGNISLDKNLCILGVP